MPSYVFVGKIMPPNAFFHKGDRRFLLGKRAGLLEADFQDNLTQAMFQAEMGPDNTGSECRGGFPAKNSARKEVLFVRTTYVRKTLSTAACRILMGTRLMRRVRRTKEGCVEKKDGEAVCLTRRKVF
ncbi:hypothetical protein [Acetobacter senegalensis]|uniref:hypothetical protein n=1 Tax=Acetobacter senegalensis TaxID=446692 RepID=UPI001EDB1E80|nr:hypothetical protein [Acetobacter senegalensis]MCG4272043.1 hypothetical protein [Acetobacter senegalensis]